MSKPSPATAPGQSFDAKAEPANGHQEIPPEPSEPARRMDAELKVMSSIVRTLDGLDADARGRVIRWLADRYENISPK